MTHADEQALLRFPGSVPGVLRRGSPGLVIAGLYQVVVAGLVYQGAPGEVTHADCVGLFTVARHTLRDVYLDLTDATGRAHLAWWLAEQTAEPKGAFAALWYGTPDGSMGQRAGIWRLSFRSLSWPMTPSSCGRQVYTARDCPALAALDPDDARLLPDGSRLVDALALSLVARRVAGLEVQP